MRKPEIAKNTSTPTKPPGIASGQTWKMTTVSTAIARSAWISGRTRERFSAAGSGSASCPAGLS